MAEETRAAAVPGTPSSGLILWMVLLGGYSTIRGISAIPQWSAYSTLTQFYYAVLLAAGACLTALGLFHLVFHGEARLLAIVEVSVLVLLTLNQAVGLMWSSILCYSPG